MEKTVARCDAMWSFSAHKNVQNTTNYLSLKLFHIHEKTIQIVIEYRGVSSFYVAAQNFTAILYICLKIVILLLTNPGVQWTAISSPQISWTKKKQ